MDLNHVLLWLVPISLLPWLWRLQRVTGWRVTGWTVVGLLVLAVWGVGLVAYPDYAGVYAFFAWLVLIATPQVGARLILALTGRQKFRWATRVSRLVAILHPADGWWDHTRALNVLACLQEGQLAKAQASLDRIGRETTPIGRFAHLQTLRAQNRWEDILAWIDGHPRREALLADDMTHGPYVRALGELQRVDDMLALSSPADHPTGPESLLVLLGLSGQVEMMERLFAGPLARYKPEVQVYWRATVRQAAGRHDEAEKMLSSLVESSDALVRAGVQWRLQQPLQAVDPQELSKPAQEVLSALQQLAQRICMHHQAQRAHARQNRPWMTLGLLAVELLAFACELPGGTENPENLYELGAMVGPVALLEGEYWRLLTAGFLHFGWLHLGLNAAGIFFFGRHLEQAIGALRFGMVYLASSVGAMAILLVVNEWLTAEPFLIVGASASLMGIVGALLAVSIKRLWFRKDKALWRPILSLMFVIGIQTLFDLSTPQVSMGAHLGGASLGFLLTLGFTKLRQPGVGTKDVDTTTPDEGV